MIGKNDQRGFALVTALMLTLISLAIIGALLQMMTAGIKMSGGQKRYRTAMEAAYGGAEVIASEIIPQIFLGYSAGKVGEGFAALGMTTTSGCLNQKITLATASWNSSCSQSLSAKADPDVTMLLPGPSPDKNFRVSAKIVDNVPGNTDTSGLQLEGSGVAEGSGVITPEHIPFMYRLEVQGEPVSGAVEQAAVSVLYAY